ncbi:hypothetical protein PSU4_40160 [Pseudonocardia sulfidoxydans NBRC 16205]|uniref:Uncharacterized protein n=1 Tax=Pseudonocardia sulfidoxydans NBRC 16205 TaxID=1223511 RepID=A0A511DJU0_9PSEU|nr:hypothetical protein [Pseudonocardia sulfidoxydans]GEL25062.1 hypothetical protein PSU4_40160 [Pseudonocardia sulfidoxydans NBRC 16205]
MQPPHTPPPATRRRRWLLIGAAVATWLATIATIGAFSTATAGPLQVDAQAARVVVDSPVYPQSPDGWWACAWQFDCRPTARREPGDPPPLRQIPRGQDVTVVCQFGAYSKIETVDLAGWTATTALHTRTPLPTSCTAFDV